MNLRLTILSLLLPLALFSKEQILPTGKIYCVTESTATELLEATKNKSIDAVSSLLSQKKCFVTRSDVPFTILQNKTSLVEIEMFGIDAWIINPNFLRKTTSKTATEPAPESTTLGTSDFKANIVLNKSVWTFACKTINDFNIAKEQQGNKNVSNTNSLIGTNTCPLIARNRPIIFLGLVQKDVAKIRFVPGNQDEPNIRFKDEYLIGSSFLDLPPK